MYLTLVATGYRHSVPTIDAIPSSFVAARWSAWMTAHSPAILHTFDASFFSQYGPFEAGQRILWAAVIDRLTAHSCSLFSFSFALFLCNVSLSERWSHC